MNGNVSPSGESSLEFRARLNREERAEIEAARKNPWNGLISLGEQQIRTPASGSSPAKIRKIEAYVDINDQQKLWYRIPGTHNLQPAFDRTPAPRPEASFWASAKWPERELPVEPRKEEPIEEPDPTVAAAARLLGRWLRG
jgi:hypothetical protein